MNPSSLRGAISIVPLNVVPAHRPKWPRGVREEASSGTWNARAVARSKPVSPRSAGRQLTRLIYSVSAFEVIPEGSWEYFEDESLTSANTSQTLEEDYDMGDWVRRGFVEELV